MVGNLVDSSFYCNILGSCRKFCQKKCCIKVIKNEKDIIVVRSCDFFLSFCFVFALTSWK